MRLSDQETRALKQFGEALSELVDRFGIAFVALIVMVSTVRLMGSAKTQDDFIRELLFGEVTGGRSLAIFFVCMVITTTLGLDGVRRERLADGVEFRRIVDEKHLWEERALRAERSQTDGRKP